MRKRVILRYPGGKLKAIKFICPFWEQIDHDEYREPFFGGGSVFISKPLSKFNWVNDINLDLIAFYKAISQKGTREKLISELLSLKITKELYDQLFYSKPTERLERAKKFYVLNRCSFSGITKWNSFIGDVRYNIKQAQHIINEVGIKLSKVEITNIDFENVITAKPRGSGKIFMFIDPPYAESRQVVAYEHPFDTKDHIRLARLLKKTKYPFLLTYDDCEFIRTLYDWANLYEYSWTYTVANSRVHHNPREKGKELFITNFKLIEVTQENSSLNKFLEPIKN